MRNATTRKRTRNTKTHKRKNYKRNTFKKITKIIKIIKHKKTRKQYLRKTSNPKKQYGGAFNNEQLDRIRSAIDYYQYNEPFTEAEIAEYIDKLNDISQLHSGGTRAFDAFYDNMTEHLEGLVPGVTFKQWVDNVYEEHKSRVKTDSEAETESDEDDFF